MENLYKEVLDNCSAIQVNLSDVYMWACADSEIIESDDIEELEELFKTFGVEFTLWAYVTVKRSFKNPEWLKTYPQEPMLKHISKTKKFFDKARQEILKLVDQDLILYEELYDQKQKEEEIKEFGEPIIKKWFHSIEGFPKNWCLVQLEKSDISGIGRNMNDARKDLERKFKELDK